MNIGFAGCSYTAGAELDNPEEERYSAKVCEHLLANEINTAKNNYSNDMICKKTLELVESVDVDFMIVQVSSFLRFSFPFDNECVTINPHRRQKYDYDYVAKIVYSKESDYSHWYELTRWKILSIHHYLKNKKINHLFLFMLQSDADMFMRDIMIDQEFRKRCEFTSLMEFTKKNDYGFLKGMHPSARAHEMIAKELVVPKMGELL